MITINSSKTQPKNRVLSLLLALLFVLTTLAAGATTVFAASYPKPTDNVADSAGILSEGTIRSIRNANEATAEEVGAVIALCTVSTTGDTAIGEYARGVFKDWKLGESILILIAVDDMNYYFLQSTSIDSVLTNDELREITNEYLENDFVDGNIDTGVMKVSSKLSSILSSRLPKVETNDSDKNETKSAGSVIAGFFKAILIIIIIAVVAFVALFVIALFNDDVAALFRKYIFRKKQRPNVPVVQYDERLYGRPQRPQQRPQQRPNGNQQRPQQGQYRQAPQQRRPQNNGYTGYSYNNYNNYSNNYSGYGSFNPQSDEYYDSNGMRRR